jgi:hypothetical protein
MRPGRQSVAGTSHLVAEVQVDRPGVGDRTEERDFATRQREMHLLGPPLSHRVSKPADQFK